MMKTKLNRKMSWLFSFAGLAALLSPVLMTENEYQPAADNEVTNSLRQKVAEYNSRFPEERIYVQCDKPFYAAGDDIWFSLYLRDGLSLKPSGVSDIVSAELIDPKGSVVQKIALVQKKGKVAGDFHLGDDAPGGLYKIRAGTQWMKNFGETNYFERSIQVQDVVLPQIKMKLDFDRKAYGPGDEVFADLELSSNENKPLAAAKVKFSVSLQGTKTEEGSVVSAADGSARVRFKLPARLGSSDGIINLMIDHNGSTESISRSVPIVLNKIALHFYPEGGDLVNGIASRLAFRAVNEFGKPADLQGEIVTEKGSRVALFSSLHNGMGAVDFTPQKGERYKARILRPEGIRGEFELPAAEDHGYVMNVENTGRDALTLRVSGTETGELSLVAQVRGKICYTTVFDLAAGSRKITIPTKDLPIGVAQLTLFDSHSIARAERLVFVNRHKRMNISVETDKDKYLPREKVRMHISVKDERGLPMPANLSMAVVNDQLLSFADDRSGNILSELLLQQDLTEKIEEPSFYFSDSEPKATAALDHLLMTAGWRKFTWENLLGDEFPQLKFEAQKAIIAGTITDGNTGLPLTGCSIKAMNGPVIPHDGKGNFSLSHFDLSEPLTIMFSCPGYQAQSVQVAEYSAFMNIALYNNVYRDKYHKRMAHDNEWPAAVQAAEFAQAGGMDRGAVMEKDDMLEKKVVMKNGVAKHKAAIATGKAAAEVPAVMDLRFAGPQPQAAGEQVIHNRVYYRARKFAAPVYLADEKPAQRSDFRNTIFWDPLIEIGNSGKKTIEFFTSDDITSFRTVVEGMSADGSIGRSEKNFFTQLPFTVSAKIPVEVVNGDMLEIPLTMVNNSGGPLGGILSCDASPQLKAMQSATLEQTIMPGAGKTIALKFKIDGEPSVATLTLNFRSCGLSDAIAKELKIVPRGFPVSVAFSGRELEKEYTFNTSDLVKGSLQASFTAFPGVVSDLLTGIEGILQEPYGCFEQTSCTAYPNAMVLDYLKHTGSRESKVLAHAEGLLDRGYKRLTSFETPARGYEWFGASPAHEGLTAYGIMEFADMKRAGQKVDEQMMDRTARWLLSHRDGKGGFEREKRALHDFGRISDDIMNSYIVYALTDAGYTDLQREFEASYEKAVASDDAYMLAMTCSAALALKKTEKAKTLMSKLLSKQEKDGSFHGKTHSITYSQGQSLIIETTALAALAIINGGAQDAGALNSAVRYLLSSRSGSGVFSSTQGTVLALKALTSYAKYSRKSAEGGRFAILIDGKKVAEREFTGSEKEAITVGSLEKFTDRNATHRIRIRFEGAKEALPYTVSLKWSTTLPVNDESCSVGLSSALASSSAKTGETVRLHTTIKNKTSHDIPSTMAIIGIPAGCSAQPWQLKELQEKGVFDYYEIKGNNLAIYYRGMAASAIKVIDLDLKAEIPGEYEAAASCAYLYYTNEFKSWSAPGRIRITK